MDEQLVRSWVEHVIYTMSLTKALKVTIIFEDASCSTTHTMGSTTLSKSAPTVSSQTLVKTASELDLVRTHPYPWRDYYQ